MINLQNIHFGYPKKDTLFYDLNLQLVPGHIYGLLGKNGAGKTTLLKVISGLCFPNSGEAIVSGKQTVFRYPDILQKIYFVTEEIHVLNSTIQNYVNTYSDFYPHFNHEQFAYYLHEFEITDMRADMNKLSHGQRKKVVISFALAANTEILIMDEPTNGLDIPSKSIFRRVLASAAHEDCLIIISTHQIKDLHSLIDFIVILDNGEILFNERTEKITEKISFKYSEKEIDKENVLYSENTIHGYSIVTKNEYHEDSKLDIELLFNAVIMNKNKIKEIFNYEKTLL